MTEDNDIEEALTILAETGLNSEAFRKAFRRAFREKYAAEDREIRRLLEKWVSGCTPAVARHFQTGELLGLCDADAPLGTKPFIFKG